MTYDSMGRAGLVAVLASALLAGCSGAQAPGNPSMGAAPQVQAQSPGIGLAQGGDASGCQDGPLKVNPCIVDVGQDNPTQQIAVQYPTGGDLTEHNNCRKGDGRHHKNRKFAGVHGGGQNWTVTAGQRAGYCKAVFTLEGKGPTRSVTVQIHNEGSSH